MSRTYKVFQLSTKEINKEAGYLCFFRGRRENVWIVERRSRKVEVLEKEKKGG